MTAAIIIILVLWGLLGLVGAAAEWCINECALNWDYYWKPWLKLHWRDCGWALVALVSALGLVRLVLEVI